MLKRPASQSSGTPAQPGDFAACDDALASVRGSSLCAALLRGTGGAPSLLVTVALAVLPALLVLAAPASWAQPIDTDPYGTSGEFGGVNDRENTRLMGTVFDTAGTPMPDVLIWVVNDEAPAQQARARTRKTGNYLVRGMASLYTERDVYGITARARFEKEGYKTVIARIGISKNGVERLYPVMIPEGEMFDPEGFLAVLVGSVVNAKGKGVKGVVVEAWHDGQQLAASDPTKGSGEFELVLWDVGESVELVAKSKGGVETRSQVALSPRPQVDVLVAQPVNLVMER